MIKFIFDSEICLNAFYFKKIKIHISSMTYDKAKKKKIKKMNYI